MFAVPAAPTLRKSVVLVVDDSATSRVVVERQLLKLDCLVLSAGDGVTALAAIEQGGIDLVLLDCQMPDMSGYEVVRRIRQIEAARAGRDQYLPVVAISGDADALHRQRCLDSGMDAVLTKPLQPQVLHSLLTLWGAKGRSHQASSRLRSTSVGGTERAPRVDLRSLYRSTSLEDLERMMTSARNRNYLTLAGLTHRMKGASLAVGASEIVAVLDQIDVDVALATSNQSHDVEHLKARLAASLQQLQTLLLAI